MLRSFSKISILERKGREEYDFGSMIVQMPNVSKFLKIGHGLPPNVGNRGKKYTSWGGKWIVKKVIFTTVIKIKVYLRESGCGQKKQS